MYCRQSPIDVEILAIRTRGRSLGELSPYAAVLRHLPASVIEARERLLKAKREREEGAD